MVKVLIVGPNGKMGRAMVKNAERNPMIAAALFISDKDSGCYDLEEAFGHL
jgi:dihydrodipicolinate reductase